MLTRPIKHQGVTMVELMISVAVLAIILALGVPSLSIWIQNVQVRSTAESVLNGLQLARSEAVRKNIRTYFRLTNSSGMGSWSVGTVNSTSPDTFNTIQAVGTQEAGQNARLGVRTTALPATDCCKEPITAGTGMGAAPKLGVVFNAFGQVISDDSVTKVTRIDVTSAANANARRMVIVISSSGTAKLCDPALPSSDTRGCP